VRKAGPQLTDDDEGHHDRIGLLQEGHGLDDLLYRDRRSDSCRAPLSPPEILLHAVLIGERRLDRLVRLP
jgi:hypothetical protein